MQTQAHTHAHACSQMHTHARTHAHTYTLTHTHTLVFIIIGSLILCKMCLMIAIETAQQKFAGAKAISSDQFFGRDREDPFVSVNNLIITCLYYHAL